jgi:hypothetical protein
MVERALASVRSNELVLGVFVVAMNFND